MHLFIFYYKNYFIMYSLKNKVLLIGNIGNNPEIRNTENGKKLARFSLATTETYRDALGEKVKETQWHSLVAWGKLADFSEKWLTKGKQIAVEGKLVSRSYTDKDGNKKYTYEVQVNDIEMLGKAPDTAS